MFSELLRRHWLSPPLAASGLSDYRRLLIPTAIYILWVSDYLQDQRIQWLDDVVNKESAFLLVAEPLEVIVRRWLVVGYRIEPLCFRLPDEEAEVVWPFNLKERGVYVVEGRIEDVD
jgi:hypothetical protein